MFRKKSRQAVGKVRRFFLSHFRKEYVNSQAERRHGTCNQCGNCCELLFNCPFQNKDADGLSTCSIYAHRPAQCAAFPINEKCLAEVDFECTFTFSRETGLETGALSRARPEELEGSKKTGFGQTGP